MNNASRQRRLSARSAQPLPGLERPGSTHLAALRRLHVGLLTSCLLPTAYSLGHALDADVRVETRDDQALAHVEAAGEGGLVLRLRLALFVIPELAVGAVAVPA